MVLSTPDIGAILTYVCSKKIWKTSRIYLSNSFGLKIQSKWKDPFLKLTTEEKVLKTRTPTIKSGRLQKKNKGLRKGKTLFWSLVF
jgi:hypothetical protein